jgi:hypothetical protein
MRMATQGGQTSSIIISRLCPETGLDRPGIRSLQSIIFGSTCRLSLFSNLRFEWWSGSGAHHAERMGCGMGGGGWVAGCVGGVERAGGIRPHTFGAVSFGPSGSGLGVPGDLEVVRKRSTIHSMRAPLFPNRVARRHQNFEVLSQELPRPMSIADLWQKRDECCEVAHTVLGVLVFQIAA